MKQRTKNLVTLITTLVIAIIAGSLSYEMVEPNITEIDSLLEWLGMYLLVGVPLCFMAAVIVGPTILFIDGYMERLRKDR